MACFPPADSPIWHIVESVSAAVGAAATVAAAVIALVAVRQWRSQLKGTTKHETAMQVLEAARLFSYLFYDARNPFYAIAEFPAASRATRIRSDPEMASDWAHVFQGRWGLVDPQLIELARLRAKAGAVLGDEVADLIEKLARKGRELHGFFQDRVEQFRVGEAVVAGWPDQHWVERVRQSVEANPDKSARNDRYSVEFEEAHRALNTAVERSLED